MAGGPTVAAACHRRPHVLSVGGAGTTRRWAQGKQLARFRLQWRWEPGSQLNGSLSTGRSCRAFCRNLIIGSWLIVAIDFLKNVATGDHAYD